MRYLLIILMLLTPVVSAVAQQSAPDRYIRITHSSSGTEALDSLGQTWYFNYKTDSFEATPPDYDPDDDGEFADTDFGLDAPVLPPETRCTDIYHGDILDFFGTVEIGLDRRIKGSVFCGDDIVVRGLVDGEVFSLKTVTVENSGEVRGSVIAKEIILKRDGRILGNDQEVPFPNIFSNTLTFFGGILTGFKGLFISAFLLFVCVIMLALFPKNVKRASDKISQKPLVSFGWGVLGWVLFGPATGICVALLALTLIGIPLIPFLALIIVALIMLAITSVSVALGRVISSRIGSYPKSEFAASVGGIVILSIPFLIWIFFEALNLEGLSIAAMVIFIVLDSIALAIGMGGVVSTRLGFGPKKKKWKPGDPIPGYGATQTSHPSQASTAQAVSPTLPPPPPPPMPTPPPPPSSMPVSEDGSAVPASPAPTSAPPLPNPPPPIITPPPIPPTRPNLPPDKKDNPGDAT